MWHDVARGEFGRVDVSRPLRAMKDRFKELTSAMNLYNNNNNNKKDVYGDLRKAMSANKTW